MRPRIVNFLENLYEMPSINYFVPTGRILYIAALSAIVLFFIHRCKQTGLPGNIAWGAILFGILGAMVGARGFYLVQHLGYTLEHPESIWRLGGGTVSWGGYIGGLLCFLFYLRKEKALLLNYLDVLSSVLGLGPFIARWACFLNGCCYGRPTDFPWGVQFPQNSFAYNTHLKAGFIERHDFLSLSVHPVQIYSSVAGIFLFLITTYLWKRYREISGFTFLFYWLMYGIIRFVIEFFRGDGTRYTDFNLTFAQLIILIILPAVIAGFIYLFKGMKDTIKK